MAPNTIRTSNPQLFIYDFEIRKELIYTSYQNCVDENSLTLVKVVFVHEN